MDDLSEEYCTEEETLEFVEKYSLEQNWSGARPKKIRINGEVVALMEFEEGENEIEIITYEVFEKGKGFGTRIIKELMEDLSEATYLRLYAYDERSKSFWEKCGLVPVPQSNGTEVHYFKGGS